MQRPDSNRMSRLATLAIAGTLGLAGCGGSCGGNVPSASESYEATSERNGHKVEVRRRPNQTGVYLFKKGLEERDPSENSSPLFGLDTDNDGDVDQIHIKDGAEGTNLMPYADQDSLQAIYDQLETERLNRITDHFKGRKAEKLEKIRELLREDTTPIYDPGQ